MGASSLLLGLGLGLVVLGLVSMGLAQGVRRFKRWRGKWVTEEQRADAARNKKMMEVLVATEGWKMLAGVAEQQIKAANPVPTESERERRQLTKTALSYLDDFTSQLGVDEAKGTVAKSDKLALSRGILPDKVQLAVQQPETRQLYNTLDSAITLGSLILTGRQGDVQKFKQLQDLYYFGGLLKGDSGTVIKNVQNLRKLITAFDNPSISNQQLTAQMDALIAGGQPSQKLPSGVKMNPGEYMDAKGVRFRVNSDGTYSRP